MGNKTNKQRLTANESKLEPKAVSVAFTHNLKGMYEENNGDIFIRSKMKEFRVHRLIICLNSVLFKSMFSHEMEEKKSNVVDYSKYDDETIDLFLRYLYYQPALFDKISLDEFEKKSLLLELFDMHFLKDGIDAMLKQMDKIIDACNDINDLCKIITYLKSKPNLFENCYSICLKKIMLVICDILDLKKNRLTDCYDSIPAKLGIKMGIHTHKLCCKHKANNDNGLAEATRFHNINGLYYCISYTFDGPGISPPSQAIKDYCCLHRSTTTKEVIEFQKKLQYNVDIPETIKQDLMTEILKQIND